MELDFDTALEILGLPRNYTLEQLNAQWQVRSKKYHPQFVKGKETEFLILNEAKTLLGKFVVNSSSNILDTKASFGDEPVFNEDYSNKMGKGIDHEKFERNRNKLFYNDSVPVGDFKQKSALDIKANRSSVAVEDFIGEDVDSKTFNEIFEYNKRKYAGNSVVESGIDYSFGGTGANELPFQTIIKDSNSDILPVNESYRSMFNDTKFQFEKKRYTPEYNFKETKAREKELKKLRKQNLEINKTTNNDMESQLLENMRKELSENDKMSRKIKSFLRLGT